MQVKDADLNQLKKIFEKHLPDAEYYIFGSRAKGTAREASDIDIAVNSGDKIPLLLLSTIEEAFADSDIPYKVDFIDMQRIDDEFQRHILNNAIKLDIHRP